MFLPADDTLISKDKFYLENLAKIEAKQANDSKLTEIMNKIGTVATANGLTEEILNDMLNKP